MPFAPAAAEEERKRGNKGKERDEWTAKEYSGLRGEKELRTALASKGFTWITGSPADNEKLSIGKNAQFFGFVALRYESGRAANRGTLGRAFYGIANEEQRALMARAVLAEREELAAWWTAREEILTLLENHLYTGEAIDEERLGVMGARFSLLGAKVAVHEARAFAALEDSLTEQQWESIASWRADAELAGTVGRGIRVQAAGLDRDGAKQLEDLFAKAFSWLTGTPEDNEVIPIGQPAQFFGFVSIRHKSGHAANRGKIARDFIAVLTDEQQEMIHDAVELEEPAVRNFLEARHEFLEDLARLRRGSSAFREGTAHRLAEEMGRREVEAARIEAEAYTRIRASMSEEQLADAMSIRGQYIIDEAQVAALDLKDRGAVVSVLCSGCHGLPGQYREGLPAPNLDGIWERPIASGGKFQYSVALSKFRGEGDGKWTEELMDRFLEGPKRFAPGTKMEFQGLLNPEDRKAIIEYMKAVR
ncbi:MAG: hypothetical protein AAGD22_09095 [Verrucomicrobiota bacterium]